jgi:hypothetical protein
MKKLFIPQKKKNVIHEKFKDFILEESHCRSPCSAIGRASTRPMSTQ